MHGASDNNRLREAINFLPFFFFFFFFFFSQLVNRFTLARDTLAGRSSIIDTLGK